TRPAWGHHMIANGAAVQLSLIHAQRGNIQSSLPYFSAHFEFAAQQRGRLRLVQIFLPSGANEAGGPILCLKKPNLDWNSFAPVRTLPACTPSTRSDRDAFTRRQRLEGPANQDGLVRVEAPRL